MPVPTGSLCEVTIPTPEGEPRRTMGRRFGNLVAILDDDGNHSIVHAHTGLRVMVVTSDSITVAMFHVEQLCKLSTWTFQTMQQAMQHEPHLPTKLAAYARRWRTVRAVVGEKVHTGQNRA